MSDVISQLKVLIGGDSTGLNTALTQTESRAKSWAGRITGLLGGISFAGLSIGVLAAANKFQEASVQMQRATGATEEKLKGLEASLANVYKRTTASSDQVASAISILSTRTQATGKDLEDLTLKTIKLAKTQREDLGAIVPAVTQFFGAWSVATNQQAKAMDYLRTVSQQTSVPVTQLTAAAAAQAPALRALGYSWEQAIALIGNFEKSGVNSQRVMAGFNVVIKAFAKEGVTDMTAAWQTLVSKVRAGTMTFDQFAVKYGGRAGAFLFDAIRGGKTDVDSLTDSYAKMAERGGENVETMRGKLIKLQHQIEATVSAHRDLIITIGLIGPGILTAGGAFIKFGGIALPVIANIVTALRFGMIGALTATEAAVLSLAGTLGIVATTLGVIVAAAKEAAAINRDIPVNPNDRSGSMIDRLRAGYQPGWRPTTAPPKPPTEDERWAALGRALPKVDWDAEIAKYDAAAAAAKKLNDEVQKSEKFTIAASLAHEALQKQIQKTHDDLLSYATGEKKVELAVSDTSAVMETYRWALRNAAVEAVQLTINQDPLRGGIFKVDEILNQYGLTSKRAARQAYDLAVANRTVMASLAAQGKASWDDVYKLDKVLQDAWDKVDGNSVKVAESANTIRSVWSDMGRQVSTAITDMGRSLTDVIFRTQALGAAFKDLGKGIVRIILEDIIGIGINQLMKALSGLLAHLGSVGKALSGILGGGTNAAGNAAGSAGGAVAGGAGGAAGAVGGSLAGWIGGIGAAVGAVFGGLSYFQGRRMEQDVARIEETTRGLLNVIFLNGPGTLVDCAIRSFQELVGIHATLRGGIPAPTGGAALPAGASTGGMNFINCTFGQNSMGEVVRQLRLAGANI